MLLAHVLAQLLPHYMCAGLILLYMGPHTALYVCSLAGANWHACMCALSQTRTGMPVCVLSRRRELACLYVCSLAGANWHALYVCSLAGANYYCSICVLSRRRELACQRACTFSRSSCDCMSTSVDSYI